MPEHDPTLLRTIRRASRGDADARRDVVDRNAGLVWGICRRLSPDPDDDYQEVWEKVFRGLASFDPGGAAKLSTWIATIAHRHLIDRHRRRTVRGVQEELPEDLGDASSFEKGLLLHLRLEQAIARLPFDQRSVIVLHHLRGMPLERIAETEGVPLGTVKSRLHRARAQLAALLGDDA